MLNNVVLVGRIANDLELKATTNGTNFINFTIAVQRSFKNQNGDYEADFIRCKAWGKSAENMALYIGKGDTIGVRGRIETNNYTDQNGNKRYLTEVNAEKITFLSNNSKKINKEIAKSEPKEEDPFSDFGNTIDNNEFID